MAVVVIPGAFGCLLTGLIYSSFSNWGFFKHNWLILSWIVTLSSILSGTFFLGPCKTVMMEISGEIGISSLGDPAYLYYQKMNLIFGTLQVLMLMITVYISIFKPWKSGKTGKRVG